MEVRLLTFLPIDDKIISVLSRKGIKYVYKFQEESIKKILLGIDTVIVAPAASGKTEAFCVPILQKIAKRSQKRRQKILSFHVFPR